jgi:hypothetical protein
MTKWINDSLNESFIEGTFKTSNSILPVAKRVIEEQDLFYKPTIVIGKDHIEIVSTPNGFTPLRGVGRIVISFIDFQNWTDAKCEIFPYGNSVALIIYIGAALMAIWSIITLLFLRDSIGFLILGSGWIIAILSTFVSIYMNKFLLKRYSKRILNKLLK